MSTEDNREEEGFAEYDDEVPLNLTEELFEEQDEERPPAAAAHTSDDTIASTAAAAPSGPSSSSSQSEGPKAPAAVTLSTASETRVVDPLGLIVKCLPPDSDDVTLLSLFAPFGEIRLVKVWLCALLFPLGNHTICDIVGSCCILPGCRTKSGGTTSGAVEIRIRSVCQSRYNKPGLASHA